MMFGNRTENTPLLTEELGGIWKGFCVRGVPVFSLTGILLKISGLLLIVCLYTPQVLAGSFSLYGWAYINSDESYTLTSYYGQSGMVGYSEPLNTGVGFEVSFDFRISSGSPADDADGMAAAFMPDYVRVGGGGPALGVPEESGIYAVEMDTFYGDDTHNAPGDPGYMHIGITRDIYSNHLVEKQCDILADGNWHSVVITYYKNIMTVYLDGKNFLSSDQVILPETCYFGISGGTGDYYNVQSVRNISVSQNGYVLKLNANGGTVSKSVVKAQPGEAWGTLPKPSRDGYSFQGWYTAKNGGREITADSPADSDLTVYAHWTKNAESDAELIKSVTVSGVKVEKQDERHVRVSWNKTAKASGYDISVSTKKKGTKIAASTSKLYKDFPVPDGMKYICYVKVRPWVKVAGVKICGPWSKVVTYSIGTWNIRMEQFKNDPRWGIDGKAWGSSKKPELSNYGSKSCLAYVNDFVAYVYGRRNQKSDPVTRIDSTYNKGKEKKDKNISNIKTGDVVAFKNKNGSSHYFAVISYDAETGKMFTMEGNASKKIRVGDNYYRIKDGKLQINWPSKKKDNWSTRTFKWTKHFDSYKDN